MLTSIKRLYWFIQALYWQSNSMNLLAYKFTSNPFAVLLWFPRQKSSLVALICWQWTNNYWVVRRPRPSFAPKYLKIKYIIIRCIFSSFSLTREPATWHANNCLQIMVCSCIVAPKCVLLQRTFCSCVIVTMISGEKWQIAPLSCQRVT